MYSQLAEKLSVGIDTKLRSSVLSSVSLLEMHDECKQCIHDCLLCPRCEEVLRKEEIVSEVIELMKSCDIGYFDEIWSERSKDIIGRLSQLYHYDPNCELYREVILNNKKYKCDKRKEDKKKYQEASLYRKICDVSISPDLDPHAADCVREKIKNSLEEVNIAKKFKKLRNMERKIADKARGVHKLVDEKTCEFEWTDTVKEKKVRVRHCACHKEYHGEVTRNVLAMLKVKQRLRKYLIKHKRRFLHEYNPEQEVALQSFDIGDTMSLLSNLVSFFKDAMSSEYMSLVVDVCYVILVFMRTRDRVLRYASVAMLVKNYMRSDCIPDKLDDIVGKLVSFNGTIFAPEQQDFGGVTGQYASLIDKVLHSDFTDAIRKLFIGMTTYLALDKDVVSSVFRVIGSGAMKMSILLLIKEILTVCSKIYTASALWWSGRDGQPVPISEILFGANLEQELEMRYAKILAFNDHTYSGIPVDSKMFINHWIQLTNEYIRIGNAFVDRIGYHDPRATALKLKIAKITDLMLQKKAQIIKEERVPTFGVFIAGAPGVGKSVTVPMIASRPSLIRGDTFNRGQIHYQSPTAEHWEGYEPFEHNVIFMSEVAKQSTQQAKSKGDPALDKLLSIIDSNPCSLDMAFEGKGKVFCLAELLILDSNNLGLNFHALYHAPGAFWRRLLIIEQSVKAQFRKDGLEQVDPQKVKLAMDNGDIKIETDVYLFDVYKNRIDNSTMVKDYYATGIGMSDMLKLFDSMYVDHVLQNSHINSRINSMITSEYFTPIRENLPTKFLIRKDAEKDLPLREYIVGGALPDTTMRTGKQMFFDNYTALVNKYKEASNSLKIKWSSDNDDEKELLCTSRDYGAALSHLKAMKYAIIDSFCYQKKGLGIKDANIDINDKPQMDLLEESVMMSKPHRDLLLKLRSTWDTIVPQDYDEKELTLEEKDDCVIPEMCIPSFPKVSCHPRGEFKTFFPDWQKITVAEDSKCRIIAYVLWYFLVIVWNKIALSSRRLNFSQIALTSIICYAYMPVTLFAFLTTITILIFLYCFYVDNNRQTRRVINHVSLLYNAWNRLRGVYDSGSDILTRASRNPKMIMAMKALLVVASGPIFYTALNGIFSKEDNRKKVSETNVSDESYSGNDREELSQRSGKRCLYDEKIGATGAITRIKTMQDDFSWNLVQPVKAGLYVQDLQGFKDLVLLNSYQVWCGPSTQYAFMLCSEVVMMNTHFHKKSRETDLAICMSKIKMNDPNYVEVSKKIFVDLGNDITLAYAPRNAKNVVKHIITGPVQMTSCYIDDNELVAIKTDSRLTVDKQVIIESGSYQYAGFQKKGYCGKIAFCKVGNSYVIFGMHAAGEEVSNTGFATPLVQANLEKGIKLLHMKTGMPRMNDRPVSIQHLEKYIPTVNQKSPFNHIPLSGIDFHGTIDKAMVKTKSQVVDCEFRPVVPFICDVMGHVITKDFSKPLMAPIKRGDEYISPQNNALQHFNRPDVVTDEHLFDRVIDYLEQKLISRLKKENPDIHLQPYTMDEAINGASNDQYMRRINVSTAAGFGFPGKKSDYLPLTDDGVNREPLPCVLDRINEMTMHYDCGETSGVVFNVALKDEPVTIKKYREGATRLFYVQDVAFLILSRMLLGPIVTLLQHSQAFYCSVGINMFTEADKVREAFSRHPNYTEVDASKFDINAQMYVCRKRATLIYRLCKRFGYSEYALQQLNGVLSDLMDPMFLLNGDLFSKSIIASGHYGTAELNCLFILIMSVYAFMKAQDEGKIDNSLDFFEEVSGMYYGDDQGMSVSDRAAEGVNNFTIKEAFAELHMKITASDKSSSLDKFVKLENATFLKRSFRYSDRYKRYLAPLDMNSIVKMLSKSIYGNNCTPLEHDLSVANSAIVELYLHCCDDHDMSRFNKVRQILVDRLNAVYGDVGSKVFTLLKCDELIAH